MSVFVEIASIRNPAIDEVLVHHAGAGHGAGISVQDFNVFAASRGELKLELDTEEVVKLNRPSLGPKDRYDLLQRSTFVLVPVSRSISRVVEETRSSTLNDTLAVKRREFRWSAPKGRYLPSKLFTVSAAPKS